MAKSGLRKWLNNFSSSLCEEMTDPLFISDPVPAMVSTLMRSLIVSSRKALVNPEDYEARSNIMWTATWGLNGLTECGKATDWEVHMLGQAVAAFTNARLSSLPKCLK